MIRLADPRRETLVPCGVTCSKDGRTLYVACTWGHTLAIVTLGEQPKVERVAMGADSYPYTTLPAPDGERLFVSLWGKAAVAVVNLKTRKVEATWPTAVPGATAGEQHPTEMALSPDGRRLFVACANSNTCTMLDSQSGKPLEVVTSALYPNAPVGSTPNSLTLSKDGRVLLIANADNNNLAMFDVSEPGQVTIAGVYPGGLVSDERAVFERRWPDPGDEWEGIGFEGQPARAESAREPAEERVCSTSAAYFMGRWA